MKILRARIKNFNRKKYNTPKDINHTKIMKMIPRQTQSYQDITFNQDGEKSYQDADDLTKI